MRRNCIHKLFAGLHQRLSNLKRIRIIYLSPHKISFTVVKTVHTVISNTVMLHPLHYIASLVINARLLTEHDNIKARIGRNGYLELFGWERDVWI
jgi:hypothetical protein